jgi:adenine-specific DNA-methyltransferase
MARIEFAGARYVRNYHLAVPHHELDLDKKKSLSDKPSLDDNLIIHGDNLKALKALLPHYAGKVKCIYIDPPYNTGNEHWVYNDNVNSPRHKEWLGKVVDKDCQDRHDRWLSMMTPRLKLLRELLRDDGVIFISIDDNEVAHLRMLMDEIFGEENLVGEIANINNPKGRSDDKYLPRAHEYLIVYKKGPEPILYGWEPDEKVIKRYRNTDKDGQIWREIDLRKTGDNDLRSDRPNLFYYFLFNEKNK